MPLTAHGTARQQCTDWAAVAVQPCICLVGIGWYGWHWLVWLALVGMVGIGWYGRLDNNALQLWQCNHAFVNPDPYLGTCGGMDVIPTLPY